MDTRSHGRGIILVSGFVLMGLVGAGQVYGTKETGKIRVRVRPVQAEVFVDGQHMGDASYDGTLTIPKVGAGEHTVGIYNYGYVAQTYKVNVEGGKTIGLHVTLEPLAGTVPGPRGRIKILGAKRAGVFLNGKTPEYVVGHGGEFDDGFLRRNQQLLVPPGTYQLALVHGEKQIWSGPVTVAADQMTTVDARRNGEQRTERWNAPTGDLPRFKAGLASARVAVSPASGTFAANPTQIGCGESSKLTWSSSGVSRAEIAGIGEVPPSGEREVSPKETSTYTFTAVGPGGVATVNSTVNVANTFNATLDVTPREVKFRKIGARVLEAPSATVNWSTAGAGTVEVDPFGTVEGSGNRRVQPVPQQTKPGAVDETLNYTLKASNACGATETRTASLHLTGTIEAVGGGAGGATEVTTEFAVALVSVFFPTDFPEKKRPQGGLLKSQQGALARLADAFKKYLEYDPTVHLGLEAHADNRASPKHNQELTDRRAARVKGFLAGQAIAAGAIETSALGKTQQLNRDEVKQLETQNPNPPPKARLRAVRTDWLAYNRRVDVVLKPSGQRSSKYYPHAAADSNILWQEPKPRWRVVEKNQ